MVRLNVPREIFYAKELSLVVSKGWGPGLGDDNYELKGIDYPHAYIRWTGRKNMAQFLGLVSEGKLDLKPLISHRFKIDEAEEAYKAVMENKSGEYIGVLLRYDAEGSELATRIQLKKESKKAKDRINVGLIGAGTFAATTILPIIKKLPSVNLRGVASATGPSGKHAGDKFGFEYCTTDYNEILEDPDIDCVLIATRPNLHAGIVVEALNHGKDVFVEKPLALSVSELKEIVTTLRKKPHRLMVGLNRRFASLVLRAKEFLNEGGQPLVIYYLISTPPFPKDAWILDRNDGGGIVKGDMCHMVDLAQFLAGSLPVKVYAEGLPNSGVYAPNENLVVTITFANGSVASLVWLANGGKAFVSEEIEAFGGGVGCIIDNFRSLAVTRKGRKKRIWKLNRDVGHNGEFAAFFSAIQKGEEAPVDFEEYLYTTLTTFAIEESLSKGMPVEIDLGKDLV